MKNGGKMMRVAVLDLYEGQANEGMRCIRELLRDNSISNNLKLTVDEFEVRIKEQIPDLSYDVYISSGGPGSPLQSENTSWENKYFDFLDQVTGYNNDKNNKQKKYVLFICHSFQLACRYFKIGSVTKRKSTSFGVFPIHLFDEGMKEPVFRGLEDPFYAVDSRDFQVTSPNPERIDEMGGAVLAIEKERLHVPLERAIMAIRFNAYMIGTQFHPEADPEGMTRYLQREDKKKTVIENHGENKWRSMIEQLNDPDKIRLTYSKVIPNFLNYALM